MKKKTRSNLLALIAENLLRVSGIGDGFVLVVFQADVPQLRVGNVLDVNPLDFELSFPLVLEPDTRGPVVVNVAHHLSHSAKVTRAVDAVEQQHGTLRFLRGRRR